MDTKYFVSRAKTSAINIAEDDIVQITVGSLKSMRSRIVSAEDEDSLELEETISRLKYEAKLFCPRCKRYVGGESSGIACHA